MKILLMYLIFIGSLFGSVIKLPNIDNLQNKMNIEICKKHPSAFNGEAVNMFWGHSPKRNV